MGCEIVKVYKDHGIRRAKGRDKRPAFDALCRAGLGRSLKDLVGFLSEIHALGIDLFLHQQGLDTTTPAGKAMFGMLGVFAEFERAMIRERVRAGRARARAEGKRIGWPPVSGELERKAERLLRKGTGILKTAQRVGLGTGSVQRIKAEMTGPFDAAEAG